MAAQIIENIHAQNAETNPHNEEDDLIQQHIKSVIKKDLTNIINDEKKKTPLLNAMVGGRADSVKELLEDGAPIDVGTKWDESHELLTPLTFASNNDQHETACLIVGRASLEGLKPEDLHLNAAMRKACKRNSVETSKLLMMMSLNYENIYDDSIKETKEQTNKKYKYADKKGSYLHLCAFYGSKEVMKQLLAARSKEINRKDSDGNTALHLASQNGHITCVILLIKRGAQLNETNSNEDSALHLASYFGNTTCATHLIQNGTMINAQNSSGNTPLSLAVYSNTPELVYKLIRAGANLVTEDSKGKTPILIAAERGRDNLLTILINNGVNINAKNSKSHQTPLMVACKAGSAACVKELILRGASIEAKDKHRADAFTIARNRKQDEALALVVRAIRGANNFMLQDWHKVMDQELYKSLLTMLDCLIEPEMEINRVKLDFRVLEMDRKHVTPAPEDNHEYKKAGGRNPYLLQRFASCGNEEIAYHGVTRILVNRKFKQYGNMLLGFKTIMFISFLVAMLFALVQAAQKHQSPETLYSKRAMSGWDGLRYFCEVYVVLFWLINIVTELAEVFQVIIYSRLFNLSKKEEKRICSLQEEERKHRKTIKQSETMDDIINNIPKPADDLNSDPSTVFSQVTPDDEIISDSVSEYPENNKIYPTLLRKESLALKKDPIGSKKLKGELGTVKDYILEDNLIIRVLLNYFHDWYNWLDLTGLCLIFILIVYRSIIIINPYVRYLEFQWVFATFAFAVNALRLTKLLNVFKIFGTYLRIIILILYRDVPKFLLLLLLTSIFFSTTLYLSYRVPIIQDNTNGTVNYYVTLQHLHHLKAEGFDQYFYTLLYPLRVLLEGNAFDFNYLFNSLNVVAAGVYIIFLFLIIVVYLNVFIAQLSDTYAGLKANAEKTNAKFRLDFIVQTQTTSLLALFIDFRKRYYEQFYIMEDGEWLKYFKASISLLDDDDFMTQEPSDSMYTVLNKVQKQQQVNNQNLKSDIDSIKDLLKVIQEKLEN